MANQAKTIGLAEIGKDVYISDKAIIRRPHTAIVRDHVAIDEFVVIACPVFIGSYVHIAPCVSLIGGTKSLVILEDFTFIAAGTRIIAGSEDYVNGGLVGPTVPAEYRDIKYTTVVFEKYSGTGTNVSIMPGITLAEGSVVGSNSVVTKDTEPWTVYAGVPARPIKGRNKERLMEKVNELYSNLDGDKR